MSFNFENFENVFQLAEVCMQFFLLVCIKLFIRKMLIRATNIGLTWWRWW